MNDTWHRLDDAESTIVAPSVALGYTSGLTTAYMLVYVRKSAWTSVVGGTVRLGTPPVSSRTFGRFGTFGRAPHA
jgi:hypothetical protein